MTRVFNFCAGPAAMPEAVLRQVQEELLDWQGRGMSVMEISHRGEDFEKIAAEAEADLRDLMDIPQEYKVLFLSGGARGQFAMIPLNLLGGKREADYINTGIWSNYAVNEAKRYCEVNVAADGKASHYTAIPAFSEWRLNPDAAYLHYTPNETISGVQFHWRPETGKVPLVADMSSTILSAPVNVRDYGLIYASAQKNIGPAGLSIVIIREDLLDRASPLTPSIFHYQQQAEQRSFANTPPTFAWYLSGLVFKWLKQQGGPAAMAVINQRKADKLYQLIDQSALYINTVAKDCRSHMNVTFELTRPELESIFLKEAQQNGLAYLKGHVLWGGIRASIYNGVPEAAVDALAAFMQDFEQTHT